MKKSPSWSAATLILKEQNFSVQTTSNREGSLFNTLKGFFSETLLAARTNLASLRDLNWGLSVGSMEKGLKTEMNNSLRVKNEGPRHNTLGWNEHGRGHIADLGEHRSVHPPPRDNTAGATHDQKKTRLPSTPNPRNKARRLPLVFHVSTGSYGFARIVSCSIPCKNVKRAVLAIFPEFWAFLTNN